MQHSYLAKLWFLLFFTCAGFTSAFAQTGSVSGRVLDEQQQGLPGVTVVVDGTTTGNSTNSDGTFSIQNVPAGAQTLVFSFIGFNTKRQAVTVAADQNTVVPPVIIGENTTLLNEAVVVGYGTQRRQDVTGSVVSVSSREFVKGQVTNPEQLVQGKVAGVQISTAGGAPGAPANIVIRGGSSLSASNQPLIVIDGVPVDNQGLAGASNPLALINPNDIENITVLKDASATAIYGSRASNGVLLITTKQGVIGEGIHVNVSSQLSRSTPYKYVDVLTGDEFRSVVDQYGNAQQKRLLGTANTNWQKEIYRTAWTSDNNASVTGAVGKLPFRASVGYLSQQGLLQYNTLKRNSAALGLSPRLLDDHLRIDVNVKGSWVDNNFSNTDAVGAAIYFDPTKPVYSGDDSQYGGYYEWLDKSGNPNTLAPKNPVGLLNQRRNRSTVLRSIGNVQLDYRLHFLPDLHANVNLGYDAQKGNGTNFVPAAAAASFFRGGINNEYQQRKLNEILETYLKYNKTLGDNRLEVLAGYSFQRFRYDFPAVGDYRADGTLFQAAGISTNPGYALQSYYGRANYSFKDRYLVTATLRADRSSRFAPNNNTGYFPSVALGWRLKEEGFLKEVNALSELKLRVGYGQTGQQDLNDNYYPYLARYTRSESTAQYQLGYNADGTPNFYTTLRAAAYDRNIKWETTTTYNAGLDYAFLNNRIYGAVDAYIRKSTDLLSNVFVPALSNLSNQLITNVGSLTNKGLELALNVDVVKGQRFSWTANLNGSLNQNRITRLTNSADPNFRGNLVGGIAGGVGNTVQIQAVGQPTYSFYVYQQVYGADGKPVQGVYVDRNGDGVVNANDLYIYKTANPTSLVGIGSTFTYDKATLAFTLRGNLGNYAYNNNFSQANFQQNSTGFVNNLSSNVLATGFNGTPQYFSDYYVQNASFLRMQNLTLGYNVGKLYRDKLNVNLTLAAQNLFVITKYKGLDPEITTRDANNSTLNTYGIDNNVYPRPRTVTLGVNIGF